jgi:biopolymer transport protein ExbD
MSVHIPGPRLYRTIPFRHLGPKGHAGGGRASNVSLNVTPFVDMMTILVTFLLMVFSASGEIIMAQKGLQLPDAMQQDQLQRAPVIIITKDTITFNGENITTVEDVMNSEGAVAELKDRLTAEMSRFRLNKGSLPTSEKERCEAERQGLPPKPGQMCLEGLAILQADKETPAKVITNVVNTAQMVEYNKLMFAVNRRGKAAAN